MRTVIEYFLSCVDCSEILPYETEEAAQVDKFHHMKRTGHEDLIVQEVTWQGDDIE